MAGDHNAPARARGRPYGCALQAMLAGDHKGRPYDSVMRFNGLRVCKRP